MPAILRISDSKWKKSKIGNEIGTPSIDYLEGQLENFKTDLSGLRTSFEQYTSSSSEQSSGFSTVLHPTKNGWSNIYKEGWTPTSFNQQWGGSQWGNLPDGRAGDICTGYVASNTELPIGKNAVDAWSYKSFIVSHKVTTQNIWVKLRKVGNPESRIYITLENDLTDEKIPGVDSNTLAKSPEVDGRLITTEQDGAWYRFTLTIPVTLQANQTYYIVVACTDDDNGGNNHYFLKADKKSNYPSKRCGYASNAGIFKSCSVSNPGNKMAENDMCFSFLVEPTPETSWLQKGSSLGSGKLRFDVNQKPFNQARVLTKPLVEFLDEKIFTIVNRYKFDDSNLNKGKSFCDLIYGIDHDRIRLGIDAQGRIIVHVYQTNDASLSTPIRVLVGELNVLAKVKIGEVQSKTANGDPLFDDRGDPVMEDVMESVPHDIGLIVRAENDGLDFIKLYVDGVEEAIIENISLKFAPEFRELGTAYVGGGFPIITQTGDDALDFSDDFSSHEEYGYTLGTNYHDSGYQLGQLPSIKSEWTYSGTAQEPKTFFVDHKKGHLYQNKNYSPNETCHYDNASILNKTLGYMVSWRVKLVSNNNDPQDLNAVVKVADGTNFITINHKKDCIATNSLYQTYFADGRFHTLMVVAQGNTYYLFIDGKYVIDGYQRLKDSSGLNQILIGDISDTNNAEIIWDYVKIIKDRNFIPETVGADFEEFACWKSDKSIHMNLLYNRDTTSDYWQGGKRIAVKTYNGLVKDYLEKVDRKSAYQGIKPFPSNDTTEYRTVDDMEGYVLSDAFEVDFVGRYFSDDTALAHSSLFVDGVEKKEYDDMTTDTEDYIVNKYEYSGRLGLHKVEIRHKKDESGKSIYETTRRRLKITY